MELSNQIKKYRTNMGLSQEALAEKVYVTRQTISNWENNKSYPDINSLLLLSSVFDISLDQLIKGDIEIMKEEINKDELQAFNRDGIIFTFLLVLFIVSVVPLTIHLSYFGLIIAAFIFAAAMYYAIKVEKRKKKYNIQTYKEIVAFMDGKTLDKMEKAQEYGKRPYQKILLGIASAIVTFLICLIILFLAMGV